MGEFPNKEKQFKKGQSGNPKGAPRKTISFINNELEKRGAKAARKSEIVDSYLKLINLTKKEIKELVDDPSQPALVTIVGEAILSKRGFEIIEKLLDRSLGKPQQAMDLTSKGDKVNAGPKTITAIYNGEKIEFSSDDLRSK